jgi:hypothetical protein
MIEASSPTEEVTRAAMRRRHDVLARLEGRVVTELKGTKLHSNGMRPVSRCS